MDCLNCISTIFSRHAIQQMFLRRISKEDVKQIIQYGEVLAEYPDDMPFPSKLLLWFIKERPVHVVVAISKDTGVCIIITAYEPQSELWENDYRRRKK